MSKVPTQWARWIYSSCAKHFHGKAQGLSVFIEGFDRDTANLAEWFEFRADGPVYHRTSPIDIRCDIEVNIAVSVKPQGNAFRIHEVTGIVAQAFTNMICVKRLGKLTDDPKNDGSILGYLSLQPGDKESVVTSFFGKIRPDTKLIQATLEGHYRMFLTIPGDCPNG